MRELNTNLESDVIVSPPPTSRVAGPTTYRWQRAGPVLFGFVAGAVFWHFVGFWSLISELVFHGPREKIAVATSSVDRGNSKSSRADGVLVQWNTGDSADFEVARQRSRLFRNGECTTLHQDHAGGVIRRVPCPVAAPEFTDVATQRQTVDPSWGVGGTSTSNITTGSVGLETPLNSEQTDQPISTEGWTPSLEITSKP